MKRILLLLGFTIFLLPGCALLEFTTQYKDIPSGKDAQGRPVVIKTYAREGIRPIFGTDYVIPLAQRCSVDGDGSVAVCEIIDSRIASSEGFFENLTTGAALGAFFPLLKGSTTNNYGGQGGEGGRGGSGFGGNATIIDIDKGGGGHGRH